MLTKKRSSKPWKLLAVRFIWSVGLWIYWLVGGPGLTVTVMSSLTLSALSSAVRRRTYVPSVEKLAVVSTALASPKVTVPGPLTWLQVVVTAPGGFGSPSSLTVPSSVAEAGKVIV